MNIFFDEISLKIIKYFGININDLLTENDDLFKSQLILIKKLSNYFGDYVDLNDGKTKNLALNMRSTIVRLKNSSNIDNIDVASNIKNTMIGTVNAMIINAIKSKTTKKDMKTVMIKWIPSSSRHHRKLHALNYGKIMSLSTAINKGLGVEYGCKCGFKIISNADKINDTIDTINNIKKEV